MSKEDDKIQVDQLIEFFKTLQQKKPRPEQTDYSSWDQTEAEYQKEQAGWLKKVKLKKQTENQSDK